MSKLTIEQIKKINNGCSNGFSFDRSYFLFHNEKTLKKNVFLDEKDINGNDQCINAHLYYFPEYEEYTNSHGVKYNKKTGLFVPTLRLSLYHLEDNGDYGFSYGTGVNITIGEPTKRKTISYLQKCTKNDICSDENILNEYFNHKEKLNDNSLSL